MKEKLVRGRYVITDPARLPGGGLIEDGAVAIDGDEITEVGSYVEMKQRYYGAEEIGTDHHLVMPGLINSHTHGRGLTKIQLGVTDDYLETAIVDFWCLKPLDAYLDTLYANMKLIRSGVTTVLHGGYPRDRAKAHAETRASLQAYRDAGLRVAYAVEVLDQNTFVYQRDESFLDTLPRKLAERVKAVVAEVRPATAEDFVTFFARLSEEYANDRLIKLMICPAAPQWCSDGLLRRVRELANSYNTGLHLHCLESPYQREYGLQTYGKGPVEHLHELDFLGPDVSLAHAVWLTEREMEICAETGTSVCHNATSNLSFRAGILPAALMLEKGVNISIGVDGLGLNDDDDMLLEMRLVGKLHRLPRGVEHASCPTSFDVLRMATVNGARSTTIGPKIGVLDAGRQADVVLIDYAKVSEPYLDVRTHVVDALLYRASAMHVDTVLIAGDVVLRDKHFTKLDESKIIAELTAVARAEPTPQSQRWMDVMAELRPHVARFYERWETPAYQPCYTVNSLT